MNKLEPWGTLHSFFSPGPPVVEFDAEEADTITRALIDCAEHTEGELSRQCRNLHSKIVSIRREVER